MKIEKDNILAISADPYGLGLDYWKKEEYYELSRMTNLVNKIEDYTKMYKKTLILNVGNSVLADCSNQLENDLSKYITTKNNMIEIENKDLNYSNEKFSQFNRDVLNSYSNVKKKIDEERKIY
ncbi:LeoA/HP0731 family dynamin-like GTPase [Staphylococcus saprophyticus]